MNFPNEAERGKIAAAQLKALRTRIAELEILLDTVRAHERREEGSRIREELRAVLKAWTGGCRPNSFRMDVARGLYAALDRIIPE